MFLIRHFPFFLFQFCISSSEEALNLDVAPKSLLPPLVNFVPRRGHFSLFSGPKRQAARAGARPRRLRLPHEPFPVWRGGLFCGTQLLSQEGNSFLLVFWFFCSIHTLVYVSWCAMCSIYLFLPILVDGRSRGGRYRCKKRGAYSGLLQKITLYED